MSQFHNNSLNSWHMDITELAFNIVGIDCIQHTSEQMGMLVRCGFLVSHSTTLNGKVHISVPAYTKWKNEKGNLFHFSVYEKLCLILSFCLFKNAWSMCFMKCLSVVCQRTTTNYYSSKYQYIQGDTLEKMKAQLWKPIFPDKTNTKR